MPPKPLGMPRRNFFIEAFILLFREASVLNDLAAIAYRGFQFAEEISAVDVDIAATVDDHFVPALSEISRKSACVVSEPSASRLTRRASTRSCVIAFHACATWS